MHTILATNALNGIKSAKIAIVYKSKYGTTKKYAKWLAKALIKSQANCDLYEAGKISSQDLNNCELLIFAGALYGGNLSIAQNLKDFLIQAKQAIKHTAQNPKKQNITPKIHCLIIGLSNPSNTLSYQNALDKNFSQAQQKGIRFHFLQGKLDFGKLDKSDKEAMQSYRAMLHTKPNKTPQQEALLANEVIDFVNKDFLNPIIDEVLSGKITIKE